jgi:hypothetical protein
MSLAGSLQFGFQRLQFGLVGPAFSAGVQVLGQDFLVCSGQQAIGGGQQELAGLGVGERGHG